MRESVTSAGTTGFVTGLGGLITMPITVPASVAGNFVINARLVGAIAHLRGYDLSDPQVQMMIQFVVAGVGIEQVATELGVKLGEQAVGRVAARAAWAAIEAIPAILSTVDASFTRAIAALARKAFPDDVPGISVRAAVVE